MKKLFATLLILAMLAIGSITKADCQIKFVNKTECTLWVYLDWIDHPFEWNEPMNMFTGELRPGDGYLTGDKAPGEYIVRYRQAFCDWSVEKRYSLTIDLNDIEKTFPITDYRCVCEE